MIPKRRKILDITRYVTNGSLGAVADEVTHRLKRSDNVPNTSQSGQQSREVELPLPASRQHRARLDGMAKETELSIKIVMRGEPKMLIHARKGTGSNQKVRGGSKLSRLASRDHTTSPVNRESLTQQCYLRGTR